MDPRDSRKISAEILYERGLVVEIQGAVIQLETPDNSRNWKWVVSLEDSEAIGHLLRTCHNIPDTIEIALTTRNAEEKDNRALAIQVLHDQVTAISQLLKSPIELRPRWEKRVFGLTRGAQQEPAFEGSNNTISDAVYWLNTSLELFYDCLYNSGGTAEEVEAVVHELRFLFRLCIDIISMCQAYIYFVFPVWVLSARYQSFEDSYLNVMKTACQTKISMSFTRYLNCLNRLLD
jgi:hypothetical protein